MFCVVTFEIIQIQHLRANNIKTSPKSSKTQIKILANPGLARALKSPALELVVGTSRRD